MFEHTKQISICGTTKVYDGIEGIVKELEDKFSVKDYVVKKIWMCEDDKHVVVLFESNEITNSFTKDVICRFSSGEDGLVLVNRYHYYTGLSVAHLAASRDGSRVVVASRSMTGFQGEKSSFYLEDIKFTQESYEAKQSMCEGSPRSLAMSSDGQRVLVACPNEHAINGGTVYLYSDLNSNYKFVKKFEVDEAVVFGKDAFFSGDDMVVNIGVKTVIKGLIFQKLNQYEYSKDGHWDYFLEAVDLWSDLPDNLKVVIDDREVLVLNTYITH